MAKEWRFILDANLTNHTYSSVAWGVGRAQVKKKKILVTSESHASVTAIVV